MPGTAAPTIYETGTLRGVTGPTIRPGGLQLTGRGVDFCRFAPGARLADVGCGAGATVEYLRDQRGFEASGVDPSPLLLQEGRLRDASLPLLQGGAERLPYGDQSLDGVLCECVLSLVPEPDRALGEFGRVLKRGGRLVLSDLYLCSLSAPALSGPTIDGCSAGARSRKAVETMVGDAGFSLLIWEDHSALLRELAARLVLAGGSLEGFPCGAAGSGGSPGYYLLIARKD